MNKILQVDTSKGLKCEPHSEPLQLTIPEPRKSARLAQGVENPQISNVYYD